MTVSVSDGFGSSGTGTFVVTVTDAAPALAPIADRPQSPGVLFSIDTTFTDPGFPSAAGASLRYSATIDWGDGTPSNPDITTGTVQTTPGSLGVLTAGSIAGSHTYSVHGNFTVTVTLSDNLGQSASTTLTALETPPTVSAGSDQHVNQGSPVVVAATFTDPGHEAGATAASYPATIDWGDGTPSNPDITSGTVTVTPGSAGVATVGTVSGSHIYSDQGVYSVTVSVADDGGGVSQGSFSATVTDVGPTLAPLPDGWYVRGRGFTIQESFTEPGIADRDTVSGGLGRRVDQYDRRPIDVHQFEWRCGSLYRRAHCG